MVLFELFSKKKLSPAGRAQRLKEKLIASLKKVPSSTTRDSPLGPRPQSMNVAVKGSEKRAEEKKGEGGSSRGPEEGRGRAASVESPSVRKGSSSGVASPGARQTRSVW